MAEEEHFTINPDSDSCKESDEIDDFEENNEEKDIFNEESEELKVEEEKSDQDGKGEQEEAKPSGIVPLMSLPITSNEESKPSSGVVPLMSLPMVGPSDVINSEIESTAFGHWEQSAVPGWCDSAYGSFHDYGIHQDYNSELFSNQRQVGNAGKPGDSRNKASNIEMKNGQEKNSEDGSSIHVKSEEGTQQMGDSKENGSSKDQPKSKSGVVPLMSLALDNPPPLMSEPIPLMSLSSANRVTPLAPFVGNPPFFPLPMPVLSAPGEVAPLLPPSEVESLLMRQKRTPHKKKPYEREDIREEKSE